MDKPDANTQGEEGNGTPKSKGKTKGKTKGKGKGKDADGPTCANCSEPASQRCTGCGMVHYCRKNIVIKNGKKVNMCQQVSESSHERRMDSSARTYTHACT